MALSDVAVHVGQQVASHLHCALTMLLMEGIDIPGESVTMGTLNQSGRFTYNGLLSAGEIEEYCSPLFKNFSFGSADNDYYGISERVFWVVCQKGAE